MRIYCVFEDGFIVGIFESKSKAESYCKIPPEDFNYYDYEIRVFEEVKCDD